MRVYVVSDLAVWIWRVGSVRFSPRSRAIGLRPSASGRLVVVPRCSVLFFIRNLRFELSKRNCLWSVSVVTPRQVLALKLFRCEAVDTVACSSGGRLIQAFPWRSDPGLLGSILHPTSPDAFAQQRVYRLRKNSFVTA